MTWASAAPGSAGADEREARAELPYRVDCFAHPGRLTSIHCLGCGRPICWDCDVTASEDKRRSLRPGPRCSECLAAPGPAGGRQRRPAAAAVDRQRRPAAPGRQRRPAAAAVDRRFTLTPVVTGLVLVNIAVFIATTVHSGWEVALGQMPSAIARGQVYRLVTAMFVHVGLTHLLFNMVALLIVGPPVEAALGKVRFTSLYLVAGVVGFGLSFLVGPVNGLSVGASGAIFGVCGAWYSLARARHKDTAAFALLLVLLLVYSFYDPSIDWRAHVGGLATGLAAGALIAWAAHRRGRRVMTELAGAATVVAVLVAAVMVRSAQIRG